MRMRIRMIALALLAAAGCGPQKPEPAPAMTGGPTLRAVRVKSLPRLDGQADDNAWQRAPELLVKVHKGKGQERIEQDVRLRAVHDGRSLYLLAVWEDTTRDESHKSWVWDAREGKYVEGDDREDRFAIEFPLGEPFRACMMAGTAYRADVWHWKAARTNPAGYAHDKYHIIGPERSSEKAAEYKTKKGKWIFIDRRADAGTAPFRSRKAPETRETERVPSYAPRNPTGSQADVRAHGRHENGRWTLTLARRLNTGHGDDAAFEVGKTYRCAIAVFDHESDYEHRTSGEILLRLER